MVFERIEASGVGRTIGSIGSFVVRNITFRDCVVHKPVKGISTKFRDDAGTIEDVTYENILIDEPGQTAIWIGPAHPCSLQSDSDKPCAAHPCSLCWPETPLSKCNLPAVATNKNIVLRIITVNMGGNAVLHHGQRHQPHAGRRLRRRRHERRQGQGLLRAM
jgi:hypothetical protein